MSHFRISSTDPKVIVESTADGHSLGNYIHSFFSNFNLKLQVTECVARSESDQYDLTSLVRTKDNWDTPGEGGTFYINVCRPLNLVTAVSGCSGTAAVCLKKDPDGPYINLGK